jgi:hypothetical protein
MVVMIVVDGVRVRVRGIDVDILSVGSVGRCHQSGAGVAGWWVQLRGLLRGRPGARQPAGGACRASDSNALALLDADRTAADAYAVDLRSSHADPRADHDTDADAVSNADAIIHTVADSLANADAGCGPARFPAGGG